MFKLLLCHQFSPSVIDYNFLLTNELTLHVRVAGNRKIQEFCEYTVKWLIHSSNFVTL
jgi:uncharacterized membrane protein (UPF0182 family)